ncbi:MAG TPA: DUF58 domain-containing protein [Sporichthyaceae bacterium]|jgi:uncharacterized protein (DUF58 family)
MTLTGRTPLVAALGTAVVWVVGSGGAVLAVAAVLACAVLLDLLAAARPADLRLERDGPTAVRLGESVVLTLRVTNTGSRRLRGRLRDAWVPSAGSDLTHHQLDLPAGQGRLLTTTLHPTRRGDRHPDRITVRAVGPLGLAARQRAHRVPWTVRVLPEFGSRRHLPARLDRLRMLDGRNAARVRGAGTEFDSLRAWVDGDDVRSIDWRATARRTEVAVRTWRPERDRRVLIVLDCGRTAAGRVGDAPRLDAAMDAVLLLAALASAAGDRVDLLAYDRRVRAAVTGARPGRLLPDLVSALAGVEPDLVETDMRGLAAEVLRRAGRDALVVLISTLDTAPVNEGLWPVLPTLLARHRVVLAAVDDTRVAELAGGRGDAEAVYGAAAAERSRGERAATAARLTRRGVRVVAADPDELPPALADAYLALKAAGC